MPVKIETIEEILELLRIKNLIPYHSGAYLNFYETIWAFLLHADTDETILSTSIRLTAKIGSNAFKAVNECILTAQARTITSDKT